MGCGASRSAALPAAYAIEPVEGAKGATVDRESAAALQAAADGKAAAMATEAARAKTDAEAAAAKAAEEAAELAAAKANAEAAAVAAAKVEANAHEEEAAAAAAAAAKKKKAVEEAASAKADAEAAAAAMAEFPVDVCPEVMPDLRGHNTLAAQILRNTPAIYDRCRTLVTASGVPFARCCKTAFDNRGHPQVRGQFLSV
jgi:hypothetical protein